MTRGTQVWITRTLWLLAVLCFLTGIFGGTPGMAKAAMPLFLAYLLMVARLRRTAPASVEPPVVP